MRKKVALVFGGKSAEHEVSVVSCRNIYKALDTQLFEPFLLGVSKQGSWYYFPTDDVLLNQSALDDKNLSKENLISFLTQENKTFILSVSDKTMHQLDCAFPIIHGTNGEDGSLQGFFRILNLPFVGCDVLSSSICMDKVYMKIALSSAGIKNSRYVVLSKSSSENPTYAKLVADLGSPFFIKPANTGSSVGVHKVKSEAEFSQQLQDAFLYDHKVLAEEFILGREIECSVLGLNNSPKASLPGELIVKHEFYSYEAKYIDKNGADIVIPAKLSSEVIKKIQETAIASYKALACDGFARVDFFVKSNGDIYVNELNTLPGFTSISMYPKMWEASGLPYSQLITNLIQLAFEKKQTASDIKLSF